MSWLNSPFASIFLDVSIFFSGNKIREPEVADDEMMPTPVVGAHWG
jgi:hypothetical protein